MKNLCFFFVLIISASCSKKQSNQDSQKESSHIERTILVDSLLLKRADSLIASGRASYFKKNLVQSGNDLFQADSILKSQGQWSLVVRNLLNTILLAQATKQSQDSINALVEYTQQIVDELPKNNWNTGLFYRKKAELFYANKHYENSKFYTLKSLNIFLSHPETVQNAIELKSGYELLASLEINLSNYEKALTFYKKIIALEDHFNLRSDKSYTQLFYLNSLMGNDEEALALIDYIESSRLLEKSSLFTSFDFYRDCGYFYLKKKEFLKALQMLDKQNELIASSPYKVHFSAWFQNQLKAEIYTKMGNYSKSIAILNDIKIDEDTSNISLIREGSNNYMLAKNYLLLEDVDKYMYYIQKAINFHLPQSVKKAGFFDTLNFANAIVKEELLQLLQSKSSFCLKEYRETKDTKYKEIALRTFEQQQLLINSIGAISEEDKFVASFNYKKMYEDYFSLLHEDWLENPTQELFYKVFSILDQSKNNVVLGEIKKMQKERLFKNISQELLQEEQALRYTLDTISIVAINDVYTDKIDSLTNRLESVKQILKTKHPKYYQLSYGTDIPIETLLQEHFKEDNMVSFLVGEQHVYVLNQKDGTQVFDKIKFNEKQIQDVDNYIKAIRSPNNQTFAALETSLYNTLFENYTQTNGRTVLSLDDILHLLPVEGIISNHTTATSQSFVRVNSILTYQKYESEVKNDPLIFAPFAMSENMERELPGTIKEATNIKKAIGGSIIMNTDATKKVFLEQASNSGVLHIATHASVNINAPLKSTIFFSETVDQEPSETQLQLKELYGLRLDNELVTLSACETGLGKEIKGKGLQSISNAFAYAGVGSTVMSLWQVPDAQTEQIMTTFYTNLKEGQPKDVALQNSKEAYLQSVDDDALKHPYFWAGFVISGDVSALKDDSGISQYLILGGVLFLIVIGVFGFIKMRKEAT